MNLKQILQFSIGPIGAGLLSLATLPIVAWFFLAEDVGRLAMLQVTISFTLLLFSLGLDQAYVREYHEIDNKPALLRAVIAPGLSLLTILCILFLMTLSLSKALFDLDSILIELLLIAAILFSFHSRFLSLILRMQKRGMAFSMLQILPKLVFLILISVYIWISMAATFENLMAAQVFSLMIVFIASSWNTRKDWIPALTSNVDRAKQKQMVRYAIPLIGSGLAFWGLIAMDRFYLKAYASLEELAVYSVSVSFTGAALVFQTLFTTVWLPIVYKWAVDDVDPKKVENVINYVTLAIVSIWSLTGVFSWVVPYILPQQYEEVQYILLAAMAYPLLYTLSEATGVGVGIKRKTMYSLMATIIALVVNASLNYILIPLQGALGAAIASAVSFFVFFMIRTEASARLWESFNRVKMYSVILMLVLMSIFSKFISHWHFLVFLLICLAFLYRIEFINITNLVKKYIKKPV